MKNIDLAKSIQEVAVSIACAAEQNACAILKLCEKIEISNGQIKRALLSGDDRKH